MRDLTANEKAFVELIRAYERAIEAKQLSFLITVNTEGMFAIFKGETAGRYKTISCRESKDEAEKPFFFVRFHMAEAEKYMHFLLQQCDMALLPNYKLILSDGNLIEI